MNNETLKQWTMNNQMKNDNAILPNEILPKFSFQNFFEKFLFVLKMEGELENIFKYENLEIFSQ